MNFSKLRHRVIFLSPSEDLTNDMGETVPRYRAFKPYLAMNNQPSDRPYLSKNSNDEYILLKADGTEYTTGIKDYSVAGLVAPMSGREYEESQKLRVETTYKISVRYFSTINATHRILYNKQKYDIVSVLDLDGKHIELQIVATENDKTTAQDTGSNTGGSTGSDTDD